MEISVPRSVIRVQPPLCVFLYQDSTERVTCARIVELVAILSGVSKRDILGVWRAAPISRARIAAYWLSRRLTPHSFPMIAAAFDRDHTTIITGCRRARQLYASDPCFADLVDAVMIAFTGAKQ